MGIYIKGMEMPKSCIACLLNFGEKRPEYGLTICCPYSNGVISWLDKAFDNGRLASCGIVAVPPHGRLGDLDALEKLFLNEAGKHKGIGGAMVTIAALCIANAPTIIPADPAEEGET